MPIRELAAKDAALFLWSTNAHLHDAIKVMEDWGFSYCSDMVWVKDHDKTGLGWNFRTQHETLLFGKRGSFPPPKPANRVSSVLHSPRRRHSQKPDEVYDIIERMYPGRGPKIELFARQRHPGWHAWGNEVLNSNLDLLAV